VGDKLNRTVSRKHPPPSGDAENRVCFDASATFRDAAGAEADASRRESAMSKRAIRDVANTLPHMFGSRTSNEDFKLLAALPDGTLTIDLLAATAHHDAGAALKLPVVATLAAWLKGRLASQFTTDVVGAMIVVVIRTDRVPTDRARIIPFELYCTAAVSTSGWTYSSPRVFRLEWYEPVAFKSPKRTLFQRIFAARPKTGYQSGFR
jgi:hypothetical protein